MSPHTRSVDPAEENDADDEGEIWYNPIPEDDEPEVSHRPSIRLLVPSPQRRLSRGGRDAGRIVEVGGAGQEAHAEGLGGVSGDAIQGNAAHSTEAVHLHRQMLACKPQEEGGPSSSKPTGEEKKKDTPTPFPSCFLSSCLAASHSGQIFVVVCTLTAHYSQWLQCSN